MGLSPRSLTSIDAIGYIANRGGKVGRIIPLLNYPKIVVDEQRRAARTVGQHQRSVRLATGQRCRTGATHAEPHPLRDRAPGVLPGHSLVEIARQDDLAPPALLAAPSEPRNIVGDRTEHIGAVGPDVATAVAVEIDGIAQEGRRHELALTHGAGPGADH